MLELTGLITWIDGLLISLLREMLGLPLWLVELIEIGLAGAVILVFAAVVVLFLVWWERKVSARMQNRVGPTRVGWHGLLQTIADAVKLLQKEDIVPNSVDKPVHFWAPVVVFATAFAVYAVVPFGEGLQVTDVNVGLLYIFAVTTFTVIALLMAGWSSNNKYSLLGGFRSAAQVVSYEVPLTLSALGVIMLSETFQMGELVAQQASFADWYIFRQPLGFLLFFTAATAEANRTPFDLSEADSELVAGFVTEYSGMKFAMFFLAEFLNMFTACLVTVTLFLGGWNGPWLPSWMWFMIKVLGLVFVMMWFRWTFPRLRVDQLMGFAWKLLLPLAFLNIVLTGFGIWLF